MMEKMNLNELFNPTTLMIGGTGSGVAAQTDQVIEAVEFFSYPLFEVGPFLFTWGTMFSFFFFALTLFGFVWGLIRKKK